MKLKFAFIAMLISALAACGASEGGDSVYIAPDLTMTLRVNDAEIPFTTTIGPNGASIVLSSGQRLEIGSNTPVVFDLGLNAATASDVTMTSHSWNGVITSTEDTNVRFKISSALDSSTSVVINVNVTAPR